MPLRVEFEEVDQFIQLYLRGAGECFVWVPLNTGNFERRPAHPTVSEGLVVKGLDFGQLNFPEGLCGVGGDELAAIFLGAHALRDATVAKEKMLTCPKDPKVRCGIAPAAAGDTAAVLIERLYAAIRKA